MTELEEQLAAALKRLSAQFETAQRQRAEERRQDSEQVEALRQHVERQAEENAILRQRIERLDGQLRGLARDYATLAATLREL